MLKNTSSWQQFVNSEVLSCWFYLKKEESHIKYILFPIIYLINCIFKVVFNKKVVSVAPVLNPLIRDEAPFVSPPRVAVDGGANPAPPTPHSRTRGSPGHVHTPPSSPAPACVEPAPLCSLSSIQTADPNLSPAEPSLSASVSLPLMSSLKRTFRFGLRNIRSLVFFKISFHPFF